MCIRDRGSVHLSKGKVAIESVSGKHGPATVQIAGSGFVDKHDWDLKIKAENVPVDDDLRKAMPAALASVTSTLKFTGALDFEFPKLLVRRSGYPATQTAGTTKQADTPLDIDFVTRIKANNATIDLGVGLSDCHPMMELTGADVA